MILTYGPVFSTVKAPTPVLDQLQAEFRVRNPNFDANVHDPDEVPPYFEFFDRDTGYLFTGLVCACLNWAKRCHHEVSLVGWPYDPVEGWSASLPEVDLNCLPGITLKEHQVTAIQKALKAGRGILEMATGSGKSEVAIALTVLLGKPRTLYLVPDCASMHQMYDRYLLRGFGEKEVGRLGDDAYEVDRNVVVAVVNSVYSGIKTRDAKILSLLTEAELFVADEVHHQATAFTWQVVATQCLALRRYGLSGTPYKDAASRFNPSYIHPFDSFLTGLLGPTLVYVPPSQLQNIGELTKCEIVSFPSGGDQVTTMPVMNEWMARANWRKVYKFGIVQNQTRNARICTIAANLADLGRVPLISVEALEHGRELQRILLAEFGVWSACSYGSGVQYVPREFAVKFDLAHEDIPIYDRPPTAKNKKTKKPPRVVGQEEDFVQVSKRVDLLWYLQRGDLKVLIGSRIFDEAMDIPFLGELINGSGGKADQRFRQKVGRVLRRSSGKGVARIWEPWDTCHEYLEKHSALRLKSAEAQGWPVTNAAREGLEWMYTVRASILKVGGDPTMKMNELEVACELTIPVDSGPNQKFMFVKPRVSLRAKLDESDDVQECQKRLSAIVKALFMKEACRQAATLSEISTKGFVNAAKDYLAQFSEGSTAAT